MDFNAFRCPNCKKTYTEAHTRLLEDMTIADEKALLALQCLVEGNSLRSIERITGLNINTLMKMLVKGLVRSARRSWATTDC